MKTSILSLLLALATAGAFAPTPLATQHSTELGLFGNRKKSNEQKADKGPGMMDQLAMFKKAQEMAKKKNEIDQALSAMNFQGIGAGGKVQARFKFVPGTNPMDPSPDFEAVSFDFDDEWYQSASAEEISSSTVEAIRNGIENTNAVATEKYQTLQEDLMAAFGEQGNSP